MEDLDAGDGLHGLAVNGADDSDESKDEKKQCVSEAVKQDNVLL